MIQIKCEVCDGRGKIDGTGLKIGRQMFTCSHCKGSGWADPLPIRPENRKKFVNWAKDRNRD
jgi:DnaJ-class molecular chaperone